MKKRNGTPRRRGGRWRRQRFLKETTPAGEEGQLRTAARIRRATSRRFQSTSRRLRSTSRRHQADTDNVKFPDGRKDSTATTKDSTATTRDSTTTAKGFDKLSKGKRGNGDDKQLLTSLGGTDLDLTAQRGDGTQISFDAAQISAVRDAD